MLYRKILDGDDMERIYRHNLTLRVHDRQRTRRDQNHFGMLHRILVPIRSPHSEGRESAAADALSNAIQVHAQIL